MELLLTAADLALTRAGGSTVAELAVVGLPSVLVPFPAAPRDHQRANAMALVSRGAAVLVDDSEMTSARFCELIDDLTVGDRLSRMGAAATEVGTPDAADAVARLVLANAEH